MTFHPRLALPVLLACTVFALAARHASAATVRGTTRKAAARRVVHAHTAALGVRAVRFARHLLGVPYVYGGTSPRTGFDCSGFVRFVYDHFGFHLPHSSYADFSLGRRVSRGGLRIGDLVFFHGLGHVGIYVGGGRFIHAPHTGARVSFSTLAAYSAEYDGARRLVR